MSFSAGGLLNRRGEGTHDVVLAATAIILAVTVFYVDTFTSIESAIAVLYVIVLMLASELLTRKGLIAGAFGCATLALSSYFLTHGWDPDLQTFLRLAVSLAALTITTALLLRTETFRREILETNAALAESEKRYRAIFDQARVALWERDYSRVRAFLMDIKKTGVRSFKEHVRENPNVVYCCIDMTRNVAWNEAARELLGESSITGEISSMRQLIVPNDPTFLELMEAIFDERDHFEGKGAIITTSGEKKQVLLSVRFPDNQHAFQRVVVGMFDVTQRELMQKSLRDAEAELARASRAATIGAMSASLAHELNQPLGAIAVNSQTLLRWLDRDPPDLVAVRRSAERMVRDSNRASQIIQNTRNLLSRKESETEWIDLETLVMETRTLMDHDLQRDDVMVDLTVEPDLPVVKAVRIEIQQVLINLITNAIQAIVSSGAASRLLSISLGRHENDQVRIVVRDSGPGLSEEDMTRIFTPFFSTKPLGMGMGLSICRSMIEARGGRLDGTNHPDGGAVFHMILPIEDKHD